MLGALNPLIGVCPVLSPTRSQNHCWASWLNAPWGPLRTQPFIPSAPEPLPRFIVAVEFWSLSVTFDAAWLVETRQPAQNKTARVRNGLPFTRRANKLFMIL